MPRLFSRHCLSSCLITYDGKIDSGAPHQEAAIPWKSLWLKKLSFQARTIFSRKTAFPFTWDFIRSQVKHTPIHPSIYSPTHSNLFIHLLTHPSTHQHAHTLPSTHSSLHPSSIQTLNMFIPTFTYSSTFHIHQMLFQVLGAYSQPNKDLHLNELYILEKLNRK